MVSWGSGNLVFKDEVLEICKRSEMEEASWKRCVQGL